MALVTCDVFSDALAMGTTITVLLPQPTDAQIGVDPAPQRDDPSVLYLLHGLSDDHTAWLRYTSVERYAASAGLAVVMPAVGRSFYANEAHGHRYWDYVSQELPEIVQSFFRVTQDPARTYVAGLSMGGYGALKLALRQPERFAAAASLSGALDLVALLQRPDRDDLRNRVFGGRPQSGDDLLALLHQTRLPRLWIGCGTEDDLFTDNRTFVEAAETHGHDVTVDFRPGEHEWGLWDTLLPGVIGWLADSD